MEQREEGLGVSTEVSIIRRKEACRYWAIAQCNYWERVLGVRCWAYCTTQTSTDTRLRARSSVPLAYTHVAVPYGALLA